MKPVFPTPGTTVPQPRSISNSVIVFAQQGARALLNGARRSRLFAQRLLHALASVVAAETRPDYWAKARDWQIDCTIEGKKGERKTACVLPQCWFRGQKMMATDTAANAGYGTRIKGVFIGQKLQRPVGLTGGLTIFFSHNALGNGTQWDDCHPALYITFEIEFLEDCTWSATVFGKAILDWPDVNATHDGGFSAAA